MARLKIIRTTQSALTSQASANGLLSGEPYLITDSGAGRLAVGTGVNTYVTFARHDELGGETWDGSYRPQPDWVDISTVGDNEINILASDMGGGVAVYVSIEGTSQTYSIDWGDGNVDHSVAQDTTQTHTYTLGGGTACSEGYTTFKIRIYNATAAIIIFKLQTPPNSLYCGVLLVEHNLTTLVTMVDYLGGANNRNHFMEYIKVDTLTGIGSLQRAFQQSYGLKYLELPSSFGNVSTINNMCYGCTSLRKVVFPTSFGTITSTAGAFQNCEALLAFTLPSSWGQVNTTYGMFQSNYVVRSITLPSTRYNSMSTCDYMFYNCASLTTINNVDKLGGTTSTTSMAQTFYNCTSLTSDLNITARLSKFDCYGSSSSNRIPVTSIRLTEGGNYWGSSSPQINISYTNLDATALNTLFGDLATVTSKTIKITGATGAATCDTSIATAKGWTVTS